MDMKENLVEIIQNSVGGCARHWAEVIADGLIANGVTLESYDCHWATEQAYKNGYEAGKKDALGRETIKGNIELYKRLMLHTSLSATGCWVWGGSTRSGYGRITVGSRTDGTRKTMSTHRLAYELHYGEIPEGMEICHKCDNRRCVNPAHLFLGTRQDNIDDREAKGRNNPPRGERHPKAKLTENDVLAIKQKRKQGKSFGKLAEEYGVNKKTIINAVTGKTWSYLPEAPKGERQ